MSTAFSSLTAKKAGGAIKWTHIEPIIHDDVLFEDNHANFYGPDIASFAQRLKEISAAEYAQRIAIQRVERAALAKARFSPKRERAARRQPDRTVLTTTFHSHGSGTVGRDGR